LGLGGEKVFADKWAPGPVPEKKKIFIARKGRFVSLRWSGLCRNGKGANSPKTRKGGDNL